jgi:hypothetical protein
MSQVSRGFLRENAFLVAAVSLPLVVAGLFLVWSFVPRLFVAPPAYDLLLRVDGVYDRLGPRMAVEYVVRDGTVEAVVRPIALDVYLQPAVLFLFDHETGVVSEVPVDLPDGMGEDDPPRTVVVGALAGRQVLAQPAAPDGYVFENRARRGPGIVGEIFGMSRSSPGAALVKDGRVVRIEFPIPNQYYNVQPVGWIVGDRSQ